MNAKQAIEKIKSEKTTFMGIDVLKYGYAIQVRENLQKMAENNELSPMEYYKSLKITWENMSSAEKGQEMSDLT